MEDQALAKGARRANENHALATDLGFPPQRLLYSVGHPVAESGRDAWRQMRVDHDRQAWFGEACEGLMATIETERREDHIVPVNRIEMDDSGALDISGRKLPVEIDAFKQLTSRFGMYRAGAYLASVQPDLRAYNVNRHLCATETKRMAGHEVERKSGGIVRMEHVVDEPDQIMLRTRNGDGQRKVFAAVSDSYQALDADDVAAVLRQVVPSDAKGEATYDGIQTRFTGLWLAEINAAELVVGDILRAGIQVRTDDTGRGSLVMQAIIEQARCVNLTKVTRTVDVLRQVHSAKGVDLRAVLQKAVDTALAKVAPFVDCWRKAAQARIIDEDLHHADVEPVFAKLVQQRMIQGQGGVGVNDEELVRRLRAAYWKQPNPTVKGVTDAITRAAHESTWAGPWVTDTLEESAGNLIRAYVKVHHTGQTAMEEAAKKGWKPGQFTPVDLLDTIPVFTFTRRDLLEM
jgi:hypothetical protein